MRILSIDIDTLRADHMGCYGYHRETTPNIDAIAREGVQFSRCYTSDAPCMPSRASLISGMFGIRNGAVGHGGTAGDRRLTGPTREFTDEIDLSSLTNVFRRAGMYTASISSFSERHSSWWFHAGFNETINVGEFGMESGERVLPQALDWLQRNKNKDNWFLHVHLWDPHTPYRAPESFGDPFADQPMPSWIDDRVLKTHLAMPGPFTINEMHLFTEDTDQQYPRQPWKAQSMRELKRIFDGYDTGVLYADCLVGKIFDALRVQGVFEDTAIIISSDHGENLGELGLYCEHGTADHATCNVPLIVKWPGGARGERDNELRYSLDLAPTMAELLGVPACEQWDGQSFAGAIRGVASPGWNSLVISQMAHVCQRSARYGDWLYMRTYHDGYHLWDPEMLFNLREDPHEQRDVKRDHPLICAQGAKIILDWHDDMMRKSCGEIDPLWTVMREGGPYHTKISEEAFEAYMERLEATGRGEHIRVYRERYKGWRR